MNNTLDEILDPIFINYSNPVPQKELKTKLEAYVAREVREAVRKEVHRRTHAAIKTELLKENPHLIEFRMNLGNEGEHQWVFAQDENYWQVAVDGRNVVSRGRAELQAEGHPTPTLKEQKDE